MTPKKILSRRKVFETPWFEIIAKTVQGEDPARPYYALRTRDYVSVVALTSEKKIVLVKQYRPSVEGLTVELPSGHVEKGQTPKVAAIQELLEETGCSAGKMELIGSFMTDTGRMMNRTWCFFSNDVRRTQKPSDPGIVPVFWTPARLFRGIEKREFSHGINLAVVFLTILKKKNIFKGFL